PRRGWCAAMAQPRGGGWRRAAARRARRRVPRDGSGRERRSRPKALPPARRGLARARRARRLRTTARGDRRQCRGAGDARARGAGLRILTGATSSPTESAALERLRQRFPEMRWVRWEPLHRGAVHEGARLAFGRPAEPIPHVEAARVVLAVESDLLSDAPGHLAYARAFAARRAAERGDMLRLYAIEASPTLTGANADHRFVVPPAEIGRVLRALVA